MVTTRKQRKGKTGTLRTRQDKTPVITEANKKPRNKVDWMKILKICKGCDEYMLPDKQHTKGICNPAIDASHGVACGGCFKWYVQKCEKHTG